MAKFPEYKREFKYTSELKENTAYMLLGHPIGFDPKAKSPFIIGAIFAEEMYFWNSVGKNICVKINCPGGGIMDGFSIMDAIRTTGASTQNVGVAASMAVSIMLSAKKSNRSAVVYSKMMIHPPSGGDKVAVDAMRGSLSQILNDTSNFSKSEIEEMLKDGAPDLWLDTKDMVKKGLVPKENIYSTNEEPEEVEENDPYVLYNVFNKLIEKTMAKPEEQSLEQSLKAFADLKNSLDEKAATIAAKEKEIGELKSKIEAIENADKQAKETASKAKVEVAIKNKQIVIPEGNTTLRAQYEKVALETPELFEAMIAAKPAAQRQSVVSHIKSEQTVLDGKETYEYLANKNPQKLYDMMDNEPEKYNQLVAEWTERVQNKKQA